MIQYFLPQTGIRPKQLRLLYMCNTELAPIILPRTMHAHNDRLEIIFITNGSGFHVIGNHQYITHKGDILIMNQGMIHDEVECPGTRLTTYCCGITGLSLPGLPENCLLPANVSPVLHAGALEDHISNIVHCMFEQVLQKKANASEVYTPLLMALIALIRQIPVNGDEDTSTTFPDPVDLADRIKLYLDCHCLESCTLDSIAQSLHMSISYLSHAFKNATGYPPVQYVIRRRIGEAQSLLINTGHPITQVSTMVGYDNTNYFSTLFTQSIGMTPREYRNYWCI